MHGDYGVRTGDNGLAYSQHPNNWRLQLQATGRPWSDIDLMRSERGKPVLRRPAASFSFDVTHQGDYVLLAMSCSPRVGVDVMRIEIDSELFFNSCVHQIHVQNGTKQRNNTLISCSGSSPPRN